MKTRIIKTLAAAFIVFVLSLLVAAGATAYALDSFARETLVRHFILTRQQAENTAMTLSKMAGILHEQPGNFAQLSWGMSELVENSEIKQDGLRIREAYLLNSEKKLLAHSDVAVLARDSGVTFEGERYEAPFHRSDRDPLLFYSIDRIEPPVDSLERMLYDYFNLVHDELLASRYMISVGVYPPDAIIPIYGLYIVYENVSGESLTARYTGIFKDSAVIGTALALASTFLISIVVFLVSGGGKAPVTTEGLPVSTEKNAEEEIPEIDLGGENSGENGEIPDEILSFEGEGGQKDMAHEKFSANEEFTGSDRVVDAIPVHIEGKIH